MGKASAATQSTKSSTGCWRAQVGQLYIALEIPVHVSLQTGAGEILSVAKDTNVRGRRQHGPAMIDRKQNNVKHFFPELAHQHVVRR